MSATTETLIAPATTGLKIDLACGAHCAPGFVGVDIAPCKGAPIAVPAGEAPQFHPDVEHVFNIFAFPWPFEDGSVAEINCSHFVEHIFAGFWHPDPIGPCYGGKEWTQHITPFQIDEKSVSLFLRFFDEVHRILEDGGKMTVVTPQAQSRRAFQDPTHAQFIVPERYLYLTRGYRQANGLEHAAYGVKCNFDVQVFPIYSGRQSGQYPRFHEDAVAAMRAHYWDAYEDLRAELVKTPWVQPETPRP